MYSRRSRNGTARIQRDGYSNIKTDWWTIRKEVFKRDGGVCQNKKANGRCGAPGNEIHHIIPLSRGGTTTKSNLITLCNACHDLKHRGQNRR